MNNGEVKKVFYSANHRVSDLIETAVTQWPYGYCEHAITQPSNNSDSWVVEIPQHFSDESLESIINAYLHVRCGFSYFDNDSATMFEWLDSGDQFETHSVKAPHKELAFALWNKVNELTKNLKEIGREEHCTMLTVVGNPISLDELQLYTEIPRYLGLNLVINTCLFDDRSKDNHIVLHVASSKRECNEDQSSYLEVPEFMRKIDG